MKKIAISLFALAAVSQLRLPAKAAATTSAIQIPILASIRIRSRAQSTSVNALVVAKDGQASTSFERLKKISEENDRGRH